MILFVLDNGPLGDLAAVAARFNWTWAASTLHIAQQIATVEATGELTRQLLERRDDRGSPWIEQHPLLIGTEAQQMYTERLRPRTSHATKNAGEDASIALLACELTQGIFVTMDGKAALSALVELGPSRVVSPFDCWRWLHDQGWIDDAARNNLDTRTLKSMGIHGRPPRLG